MGNSIDSTSWAAVRLTLNVEEEGTFGGEGQERLFATTQRWSVSAEQARTLFSVVAGQQIEAVYPLARSSSMRDGELVALVLGGCILLTCNEVLLFRSAGAIVRCQRTYEDVAHELAETG